MRAPLDILRTVFGYPAFRGHQEAVISHVVGGGDAIVLMPTGGGKSLCYQIPALCRPGTGVIVSPLIALMQDQVDALLQNGVAAAFLNSSQDFRQARETESRLAAGGLDLIYVAPERLLTPRFLELLAELHADGRLALFAIDEAHCVSQWGHDFRREYLELAVLAERFPGVPRIALTATADPLTRDEIRHRLRLDAAQLFVASFDRPNIRYEVVERDGRSQLLRFVNRWRGEAGIVYCLSRKRTEELATWLGEHGITALPYHAGLDAEVRRRHQSRFVREDGLVMVATIAFGMGIDKPDVRFVAHSDLPKSLESYYQESGRAGRDGEPAEAWLSYGLQDLVVYRQWIEESEASDERKRVERGKLDAMLAYCEAATCRRVVLLRYFGEAAEPCGNCDTCLAPPELWDGTVAAQKALSAVARTGQRFGVVHLVELLRGKASERMSQFGHDRLPTFGVGQELDEQAWRTVFRQLVVRGLLTVDLAGHNALKLTPASRPVLRGEEAVQLRRSTLADRGARKAAKAAKRAAGATVRPLDRAGQELFERLRSWRSELAGRLGVPAYVIFADKTLWALVDQRPQSRQQLLAVPGIGESKADRYGADLLDLLAAQRSAATAETP